MIQIIVQNESYLYNVYHLVKAFYPLQEIHPAVEEKASTFVSVSGLPPAAPDPGTAAPALPTESLQLAAAPKERLDLQLYEALAARTGRTLPWGVLQGVRPTKLAMRALEAGVSRADFVPAFYAAKRVSAAKAELAYDVAVRERNILAPLNYRRGFSLYVGIPFCPSICAYCSFGSGEIARYESLVPAYVAALCREIRACGAALSDRELNTVYVGGGTPTTLSPAALDEILTTIEESFSLAGLQEFTVEAGRPETISREHLVMLKRHPVSRISINPQTMQQKTLDAVGRRHTVADVYAAYERARGLGFDNINMDLIAGLPGESAADMADTLQQIEHLAPDSLTVHALAIKRAARLERQASAAAVVEAMTRQAGESAVRLDAAPYYLYRQKNIAGNFENIGYAKVDKAGLYNILIMEEKQSIIACGAGAQSKLVLPHKIAYKGRKQTNLIRVDNVKNIAEYIDRIPEMIQRKGEWLWH